MLVGHMLAPKDKRETALVAQGRSAERAASKLRAQNQHVKSLKKQVAATKREAREDLEDAEPTHKLALGGGAVAGAAAGVAAQHYVVDKYIKNKWGARATLPGVGLTALVAGMFMRGAAGDLVFGVGAGITIGSATTSVVKTLAA